MSLIHSVGTVKQPCQHSFELTCELRAGETPTEETAIALIENFTCVTCGVSLQPLERGKPVTGIRVPLVVRAAEAPEAPTATSPKGGKAQSKKVSADPKKGLPGTEMLLLTSELGIVAPSGCGCKGMAATMDKLGVDGCRERINELKLAIAANWESWGWKDKLGAVKASAWKAVGLGVSPTDPVRDLVEIAIERADKKRETS